MENTQYSLSGKNSACRIEESAIVIEGDYFYNNGISAQMNKGRIDIPRAEVLGVNITKTYSKKLLALTIWLGWISLLSMPLIVQLLLSFSSGYGRSLLLMNTATTVVKFALFFIAMTLYNNSKKKILEFSTKKGRFSVTISGIKKKEIENFQRCFYSQSQY